MDTADQTAKLEFPCTSCALSKQERHFTPIVCCYAPAHTSLCRLCHDWHCFIDAGQQHIAQMQHGTNKHMKIQLGCCTGTRARRRPSATTARSTLMVARALRLIWSSSGSRPPSSVYWCTPRLAGLALVRRRLILQRSRYACTACAFASNADLGLCS